MNKFEMVIETLFNFGCGRIGRRVIKRKYRKYWQWFWFGVLVLILWIPIHYIGKGWEYLVDLINYVRWGF